VSLLTLIFQCVLAAAQAFMAVLAARKAELKKDLDTATRQNQEMHDEEARVAASARAGDAAGGLPDGRDPLERDAAS
jgi:F0F1-type ATP synthase membrane subunit b/b'